MRQAKQKQVINYRLRDKIKKAVDAVRKDKDADLSNAYSTLDRAAKAGVIAKNKASRLKSRLTAVMKSRGAKMEAKKTTAKKAVATKSPAKKPAVKKTSPAKKTK